MESVLVNNFTRFLGEQFLGGSHLAMQAAQNLVKPENSLGQCNVSIWKRFCSYLICSLLQINSCTKYPTQINQCLCGHWFWSFLEIKNNSFSTFFLYDLMKAIAMNHQRLKRHNLSMVVTDRNGVDMSKEEINA